MIKTYEITLYSSAFKNFTTRDYQIIKDEGFNVDDYILFKEIETVGEETKETGLHRMTQIKGITNDEGLKDGFVLLTLAKL